MSTPAMSLNSSPARCGAPPFDDEAKESLPGLAFACAISSATLRTGSPGVTTRISGTEAMFVTGAKSASAS